MPSRVGRRHGRGRRGALHAVLTVLALATAVACSSASPAPSPNLPRPGAYYLSLGDSLGFGFQPGTTDFSHGYTNDLAASLQRAQPGLKVVNYACPGETSATMISGGCPSPFTKDPYNGAQLDAATAFLHAHAGAVSPITVSIGANDALPALESCTAARCPTALTTGSTAAGITTRVGTILTALRRAAPKAEILLLAPYDPLAKAKPATLGVVRSLNSRLAGVARTHGVRVADGFTPINVHPPAGQDVCSLTFYCSRHDVHPTDRGYQLLATAFLDASEYRTAVTRATALG